MRKPYSTSLDDVVINAIRPVQALADILIYSDGAENTDIGYVVDALAQYQKQLMHETLTAINTHIGRVSLHYEPGILVDTATFAEVERA